VANCHAVSVAVDPVAGVAGYEDIVEATRIFSKSQLLTDMLLTRLS